MSITITVPNDDHVALRAMAKALEEIAVARGAPSQGAHVTNTMAFNNALSDEAIKRLQRATEDLMQAAPGMLRDNNMDGSIEIHGECKQREVDTTAQQVESLSLEKLQNLNTKTPATAEFPQQWKEVATKVISETVEQGTFTDSNGTPWDERIHPASKALNADGTWRLRRKPKDMDEMEWADHVEMVKAELLHPVECGGMSPEDFIATFPAGPQKTEHNPLRGPDGVPEPSVTPAGDDFHVDAGEVTEQQIASIPVPPLPVPPTPPVQQSDMTFPQVMQFLTERHGRITSAQVDQVIADMGLNSIMDLNTQPEHTGPFIARVKALLGE